MGESKNIKTIGNFIDTVTIVQASLVNKAMGDPMMKKRARKEVEQLLPRIKRVIEKIYSDRLICDYNYTSKMDRETVTDTLSWAKEFVNEVKEPHWGSSFRYFHPDDLIKEEQTTGDN